MGKCVIILEDDKDGQVTANIAFDPPIDDGTVSPSQSFGVRVLEKAIDAVTRGYEDLPLDAA